MIIAWRCLQAYILPEMCLLAPQGSYDEYQIYMIKRKRVKVPYIFYSWISSACVTETLWAKVKQEIVTIIEARCFHSWVVFPGVVCLFGLIFVKHSLSSPNFIGHETRSYWRINHQSQILLFGPVCRDLDGNGRKWDSPPLNSLLKNVICDYTVLS